jgi:hypothetical protein
MQEWPMRRSESLPLRCMRSSSEEAGYAPSNRDHQPGNTRDIDEAVEGGSASISKDGFLPSVRENH